MFSSKYNSIAYLINSLLFTPYRATLMRTLYRITFTTPLPFIPYPLSHSYFFFFFLCIKSVFICVSFKKNLPQNRSNRTVIRERHNLLKDVIVWYVTSRTTNFHIVWHIKNCKVTQMIRISN